MKVNLHNIPGEDQELKSIILFGRSWFDRRSANSYCTCEIYLNGHFYAKTAMESGYGDYYLQAAKELLDSRGVTTKGIPFWNLRDEHRISFYTSLAMVCKREDL